jgi:NADH:ubiquinone oxidoreductase subunit H
MVDAHFLADSGFELVAAHHRFPRYRIELDEGLGWKTAVESALDNLVLMATIDVAGRERLATPTPVG